MAIAIQLPALSPTMKEGKITRWLKKEGDKVASGTAVAECETDKSNLEIESLRRRGALEDRRGGGRVAAPVGSTIAWIGKAGEKVETRRPPRPRPLRRPPRLRCARPRWPPRRRLCAPRRAGSCACAAAGGAHQRPAARLAARARRSPTDSGLDLARRGRRRPRRPHREARRRGGARPRPLAPGVPHASPRAFGCAPTALPLTQMRKVIAQRLTEVKPGVPHFYLTVELEMDAALKLREEAKALEHEDLGQRRGGEGDRGGGAPLPAHQPAVRGRPASSSCTTSTWAWRWPSRTG